MLAVFSLYMASGFHTLLYKDIPYCKFNIYQSITLKIQSEEYYVEYATACFKEEK